MGGVNLKGAINFCLCGFEFSVGIMRANCLDCRIDFFFAFLCLLLAALFFLFFPAFPFELFLAFPFFRGSSSGFFFFLSFRREDAQDVRFPLLQLFYGELPVIGGTVQRILERSLLFRKIFLDDGMRLQPDILLDAFDFIVECLLFCFRYTAVKLIVPRFISIFQLFTLFLNLCLKI